MLRKSKTSKGFTLIEALAAAALMGVGITAAMNTLSAISKTEAAVRDRSFLQNLALSKYDELISTNQQTLASQSGDFSDQNLQGYSWTLDVETSEVTDLDTVTVTVQKSNALPRDPQGRVEGMMYVSPNSTSQSTSATTTTG